MPITIQMDRLWNIANKIEDAIDAGVNNAADMVVDLAKQLAPVDTSLLQESIQKENLSNIKGRAIISAGEGCPDQRAPAQEFGTIFQPAQPYLIPAAKEIDIKLEIMKEVQRLL